MVKVPHCAIERHDIGLAPRYLSTLAGNMAGFRHNEEGRTRQSVINVKVDAPEAVETTILAARQTNVSEVRL